MEYKVIKQHYGDRQYFEGDTREVKVKADAGMLTEMGLIAEAKEEKSAPKTKNKMAKDLANKSE